MSPRPYAERKLLDQLIAQHTQRITTQLFKVILPAGRMRQSLPTTMPADLTILFREFERRHRFELAFQRAIDKRSAQLSRVLPFDHAAPSKLDHRRAWRRVVLGVAKNINDLLPEQMPDRTRRRVVRVLKQTL